MPHGPINSTTEILSRCEFTSSWGAGNYGNNVILYGNTMQPASTNNPKVGLFRSPSNWYTRRSRWNVRGMDIRWEYNLNPSSWLHNYGQLLNIQGSELRQFPLILDTLESDLIRKLLAGLTNDDVQFNAAMAQARGTCKMVHNMATGLARGTEKLLLRDFPKGPKQFKKAVLNGTSTAIRSFSGKYLEFLYGWKPLGDDIQNAFQRMDSDFQKNENSFKFSMKSRRTLRDEYAFNCDIANYWYYNGSMKQVLRRRQTSRVSLVFEFPKWYQENLPTVSPFGTAWELMPWSFVIDWFVPIGDWVGAMESMQWSPYFRGGCRSTFQKVESTVADPTFTGNNIPGWTIVGFDKPRLDGYAMQFDRHVIGPEDLIDIIRFPSIRAKLGLNQASQGIALLTQVFQKWFTGGRLDT